MKVLQIKYMHNTLEYILLNFYIRIIKSHPVLQWHVHVSVVAVWKQQTHIQNHVTEGGEKMLKIEETIFS